MVAILDQGQQWSTRSTQKTKDWATRIPLKTGSELRCYGLKRDKYKKVYQ